MSCECEHCGAEVTHRVVTLTLDGGRKRQFCSDSCERRWMELELVRHRRFLNRIYCTTRGRARDIARIALQTNEAP